MSSIVRSTVAAILLGFAVNASADLSAVPSGDYGLDVKHGYISFTYSHMGYSTPQVGFRTFDVNLTLDNANPENSKVDVVIDASSIDSRVDAFNGHLTGEKFFDAAKYPEITFTSTTIKSTGEDTFDVSGDLTIKGISKPVVLATTINKAANHPMSKKPVIGLSAETKVSRSDFGLDRAVPTVGDEVTIYVSVELPQKKTD